MVRTRNEAISWKAFKSWLLSQYKLDIARDRLNYARKYSDCLVRADLSELQGLKVEKRLHVMKALAALSKFLGIHEEWKKLLKSHGFTWSVNSDSVIINRLTKNTDSSAVFEWIKSVKQAKPDLKDFLDFMSVSGLRLVEAVESYNLIIKLAQEGKLSSYYNEERGVLEHFRFREVFIRRTKKAFMSFIPKTLIESIARNKPLTYTYVISLRKKGFKLRFGDIREAQGTFLTKYLNPAEIDFLQGRVSGSVFMRNYFNPALIGDLKERVFKAIGEIRSET